MSAYGEGRGAPAARRPRLGRFLQAPEAPGHAATLRRARRIAADWSGATASDVAGRMPAALAALLAVLIAAGVVGYLIDPSWVYTHARWAVTVGDVLVGGFVAALLYVGRETYTNSRFRRTVGVLWDIGPLRRIYGRFFPAYFGTVAFRRTGAFLRGKPLDITDGPPTLAVAQPLPPQRPHRRVDPPGLPGGGDQRGRMGRRRPRRGQPGRRHRPGVRPVARRQLYPPTRGHSGYLDERAYAASVEIVRQLRPAPREL